MPIVDWGLSKGVIDEFDREKQKQYKPYTGPKPPSGVYKWRITQMSVKAEDEERLPQWLALLVLVPRNSGERKYAGYKVWFSASIGDNNAFAYTPMLDVLGCSEIDFRRKTMTDEEGKVKRIGSWRMDGKQEILAEITDNIAEDGRLFTNVRWVGTLDEDQSDVDDDEDIDGDESDEDEDEFEEEETPKPRARKAAKKAAPRRARKTVPDDEF